MVEGVGYYILAGGVDSLVKSLFEFGQASSIGLKALLTLGPQEVEDRVFDLHGREFLVDVLGAQGRGAFEGHVFQHVGQTRILLRVVNTADIGIGYK